MTTGQALSILVVLIIYFINKHFFKYSPKLGRSTDDADINDAE